MKCKSIYFLKHFFATKGAIYLVVYIATVITSRVKVYHVFARKLTWHFTGVIISHNKIKNFAVPSGKTEERRLYSHIKKMVLKYLFYRNLGVGSSSAVGRVGSMAAPYLIWLVRLFL